MLNNPFLIIPLVAWVVAQATKFIIAAARGRVDFRYFYLSGGMPSGHSAVVCALAATAWLIEGGSSHLFGVTVVLAAIVMYDSFGVRRSSGEQAVALNAVLDHLAENRRGFDQARLREAKGHSPLQVTVGGLLGIVIACLFNLDRLSRPIAWLTATPGRIEGIAYLVVFALLVIFGLAAKFWLGRHYPKSGVFKALSKQLLWKSEIVGWLGLIAVFAQYEDLPYLSWRLWPVLLLIVLAVWDAYLWRRFRRAIPQALIEMESEARKRRWFETSKKRRK